MRLFKIVVFLSLILLVLFIAYTLISTGFFRTIEPTGHTTIFKKVPVKGAEDIMVSSVDSFALISATSRVTYPPEVEEIGSLFLMDLKSPHYQPIPLTASLKLPFAPHGISFFKKADGNYQVMAINHIKEGHSIEVFELMGKQLNHIETLRDASMIRPNDLVMLDENRFYFTNDHGYTEGLGKLVEEYTGIAVSNVVFFDGKEYREVADGIAYANGINLDRKRNLLYVASPRHFLVKVYTQNPDGSLSFVENIPCGTGVDNIELDTEGNLWIGAHPNLLKFNAYAAGKREIAPSEIIKISYRKKGDYSVEKIYVEDGSEMSASTVAAPFGNLIFAGNLMDEKFLILEQK